MKLTEAVIFSKLLEKVSRKEIIEKIFPVLEDLDYAIIGGGAVSFYSKLARTISPNDFDLVVMPTNKEMLIHNLIDQGLTFEKEHMFMGNYWLVFNYLDQDIDVAIAFDSLMVWGIKNAEVFDYYGTLVKFINKNDLICNKLIGGRNKDYRDITYLLKDMSQEDFSYLKKVVRKFVPERYEELLQIKQDSELDNSFLDQLYA